MNKSQAKKISKTHTFTRLDIYNILEAALKDLPAEYWTKPNKVNAICDNGYYFNMCKDWIFRDGVPNDTICGGLVVFRVLQVFGKYSKIQLSKKTSKIIPPESELISGIPSLPTIDE